MGFAIGASVWALAFYVLMARFAPRVLDILERKYPLQIAPEAIVIPSDIQEHINRLQTRQGRESEEGYFREQYSLNNKNWQRVRLATGLTGDGERDGERIA